LLAMVFNDDTGRLKPPGVLKFFASELAPTKSIVKKITQT